jgi:hypothetical protein
VAARRVIETIRVSDDAYVCESTEEYERAEFELLIFGRRREASKKVARINPLETDSGRLEDAPDKP